MRSWTVGLSLFATLLSTISYLATPGEIIRYGPMILSGMAAIPLIILIVGWVLIPAIMKVQVTTAYEILELHLGVSVRVLGSTFFLAQRLIWMALIIYATTSKVLVPLLQWPPSTVPYVCLALDFSLWSIRRWAVCAPWFGQMRFRRSSCSAVRSFLSW